MKLSNINKKFANENVLENFCLSIEANELVAIIEASGCGKTTLLNIMGLLGLDYAGEYFLNGEKIKAD
ncbi:MAG: ATP-binding cassette domain-containing protein [Breznakia sp.]